MEHFVNDLSYYFVRDLTLTLGLEGLSLILGLAVIVIFTALIMTTFFFIKMKKKGKSISYKQMRCISCLGEDITINSLSKWNVEKQHWEHYDFKDYTGFCYDCKRSTSIVYNTKYDPAIADWDAVIRSKAKS